MLTAVNKAMVVLYAKNANGIFLDRPIYPETIKYYPS